MVIETGANGGSPGGNQTLRKVKNESAVNAGETPGERKTVKRWGTNSIERKGRGRSALGRVEKGTHKLKKKAEGELPGPARTILSRKATESWKPKRGVIKHGNNLWEATTGKRKLAGCAGSSGGKETDQKGKERTGRKEMKKKRETI